MAELKKKRDGEPPSSQSANPKIKPGEKPQSSQEVLRRLVILFGILLGIIIYSTGWRITGIDLEETKNQDRKDSLQRALSELLSPDLLDHDSESQFVPANFMKDCPEEGTLEITQPENEDGAPYVVFSTYCASRDELVTIEGFGFHPEATGKVYVIRDSGNRQPLVVSGEEKAVDNSIFDVDKNGAFLVDVIVPNLRGNPGDIVDIEVHAAWQTSAAYASSTTKDVLVKIIETVFLALMATTSAIPIAVVISFTSARNLMRQVRLPLGETLVGFILAPVGFILGAALIGPLGDESVKVFKQADNTLVSWILTLGAVIVPLVLFGALSRAAQGIKLDAMAARLRDFLLNILLLIAVIFSLGAFSTLMVETGEFLLANEFYHVEFGDIITIQSTDLGRVLITLGEIFQMLLSFFAALGGMSLLVGFGTSTTSRIIGKVRGQQSHVMGGVLGAIGGAILMILTTELGSLAPLLIIIPPVVVTFLAIPVLMRLYDQLANNGPYKPGENSMGGQTVRFVIHLAGGIIIFALAAMFLDMVKIITRERIPETLTWQEFSFFGKTVIFTEITAKAALLGALFGGIGGVLAGTHSLFPLGNVVYYTSRTILNAMRSIEPLIMGIVFVIWVSAGPFAGVLALGLHSIAALGKLYSEQIESIDAGPIEAIQATGANRLQTIVYAVIPQIVPSYIAFTMYRWDINVRMSTIIGFVGGGGIGFLLQQQINLLRYKQAGVAVLAIAIVVSILDYASATIRERIV